MPSVSRVGPSHDAIATLRAANPLTVFLSSKFLLFFWEVSTRTIHYDCLYYGIHSLFLFLPRFLAVEQESTAGPGYNQSKAGAGRLRLGVLGAEGRLGRQEDGSLHACLGCATSTIWGFQAGGDGDHGATVGLSGHCESCSSFAAGGRAGSSDRIG
ncbi:hypothetical protein M752DRAFT_90441 [Aspergillus phoenicis ATCC 13157]|uniref:Uncharacterized protein n=1 Tax=Aspergillus phoenicis ATCC 13157 TaxID=1353007 RepID=A0A370P6W3_ASPPH|nr:hypothetical protein M752DRAFT_90441 [Aspergillus phoenicis ATCC 13157]